MTDYGTTSARIVLCEGVTDGTLTTVSPSGNKSYFLAKKIKLIEEFKSKRKVNPKGRTRVITDVKLDQGFQINNAKFVGSTDVNGTKEWIVDKYIAGTPIYAIVKLPPPSGSTYIPYRWYNYLLAKVYYLKGVIGKLEWDVENGRLIAASLNFMSAWNGSA